MKGPFAPSGLFTMEAERRWSDGEVLSKRSKVGKSQWRLRAGATSAGRAATRCFAQYQNIPFALFGSCCCFFCFFKRITNCIRQRELNSLYDTSDQNVSKEIREREGENSRSKGHFSQGIRRFETFALVSKTVCGTVL